MIARLIVLAVLAPLLGGCPAHLGGSVAGGECKVFERPPYAIRGVTQYDQDWADSTVEGGVGGCGWQRPGPRPAAIDAMPALKPIAKPAKKLGVLGRVKARASSSWPSRPIAPVVVLPDPPAPDTEPEPAAAVEPAAVVEAPIAPPPPVVKKPRALIDRLLHPVSGDE